MLLVQKEIAEEQSANQSNAIKRKALEDPALLAAPAPLEPSAKKYKPEVESDSENEEFFDAASEFINVTTESAEPEVEKPIGPIDTGYRKVNIYIYI
jgi:tRNA-dihydrouridine synthase 3